MNDLVASDGINGVIHVIQVALTPVFLLSGIGTLLNVFNTRLSRVVDQMEHAMDLLRDADDAPEAALMRAHVRRLGQRRLVLDTSVLMGALGGAATCGAAFALFLGSLRDAAIASWLVALFGSALMVTVVALLAFLVDGVLAWHGLQREGLLPRTKAGGSTSSP